MIAWIPVDNCYVWLRCPKRLNRTLYSRRLWETWFQKYSDHDLVQEDWATSTHVECPNKPDSRWLPKRACFDVVSSVVNSEARNALHVRLPSLHMRLLPNRARGHDEKNHGISLYYNIYIYTLIIHDKPIWSGIGHWTHLICKNSSILPAKRTVISKESYHAIDLRCANHTPVLSIGEGVVKEIAESHKYLGMQHLIPWSVWKLLKREIWNEMLGGSNHVRNSILRCLIFRRLTCYCGLWPWTLITSHHLRLMYVQMVSI